MDQTNGSTRPPTDPAPPPSRTGYAGGLRVGIALAAPTFVLALSFGALARTEGWGILAPIVCSALVFSGSAQFAMATALSGGSGLPTALVAAALINARYIPLGLAAASSLRGGRFRRAIEGQAVVDASWVAAHRGGGRFDRELMISATACQWLAWVLGTVVGVLVAPPPSMVEALGLDVVFPAFFLMLLVDELRKSRRARAAAALGGGLAGGFVLVVPGGLALLGAGLAALIGLVPGRVRRRS